MATPQPAENGVTEGEQLVTPWDVAGGADGKIDYDKLVRDFGCQWINQELIARIEKATGVPAHPFLKRGVFFAHRYTLVFRCYKFIYSFIFPP